MPDFRERRALPVFDGLFAYTLGELNVVFDDGPAGVSAVNASADVFRVLGVAPALGHAYSEQAESWGNHRVVLLGHGIWQERFGGREDVVGRTLRVGGESYQIAGVLPRGFSFP